MLPALFESVSFMLNLVIVLFVAYYLMHLRAKEKELNKRETKIDTNYHQVVDDALTKERRILDDAASEATKIISDAKYVNTTSKQSVDQALSKMMNDMQGEALTAAKEFKTTYATSLQQIAHTSLNEFQGVTKQLQTELQQEIKKFHETLLPKIEKELEDYKQARLKQSEATITKVVQEVSQRVLNKSVSFEDHQKLMTESLEQAKKEGVFDNG